MREKLYMQKRVDKNVEALMKYRLERSKDDLKTAKLLVKNNSIYSANNRIYYALFHAVWSVQ